MESPLHITPAFIPGPQPDVFTIDVEDWFHILDVTGTRELTKLDSLPTRVESNFRALLDLLSEFDVKATCFFLGSIARRFPRLLHEAAALGHDIASHGNSHQIICSISRAKFREDIRAAKAAIEDVTGRSIHGYRAPGFSITQETSWAFEEIIEAGYSFDSSVFPGRHGHGGIPKAPRYPYVIRTAAGRLMEFPVSITDTPFGPQCCFGGGYLRLFPVWLIQLMARRVRTEGRGVVWYIHPRDIDPDQPRLRMSLKRRFKSYVNLQSTARKLEAILRGGDFVTLNELELRVSEMEQTVAFRRIS